MEPGSGERRDANARAAAICCVFEKRWKKSETWIAETCPWSGVREPVALREESEGRILVGTV